MRLLIGFITILFFSSCESQNTLSEQEYFGYISNPENGLVIKKSVNGINMSARVLPTDYLAFQDYQEALDFDSLKNFYNQSLTFTLHLEPDEVVHGASIMSHGVHDEKELKQRAITMNFDMSNYIKLRANNTEYEPVLTTLENTYDLTNGRTVYIVFENTEELGSAEELDLVFEDEMFQTGINHFNFKGEQVKNTPKLKVN